MDAKMLNTTIDFECFDGTTEKLTLTFYALYQLKAKNKALYERYNAVMGSQSKNSYDELGMVTILYVAYMCAHLNDENVLSEEEFIYKCGFDRVAVANAVKALTQAKNSKVSVPRS